jgi:hypothetical protein
MLTALCTAPAPQGSAAPDSVVRVSTGKELLAQLNNSTAR